MSKICDLGDALNNALISDECIADLACSGEIDLVTGEPRISIGERGPDIICRPPYVGWQLLTTEPISPDADTSGWYRTQVAIFAIDHRGSVYATRLADAIQCFFTKKPQDHDLYKKWFRDISNNCILNRCTRFVRTLPLGRRNQNAFDFEKDTWSSVLEIQIIWSSCNPCSDEPCEQIELEDCDINNDDDSEKSCNNCPAGGIPDYEG